MVSPGPESCRGRGAAGTSRERRQLPGAGQRERQRGLRFVRPVSNFMAEKRTSVFLLCVSEDGAQLPNL